VEDCGLLIKRIWSIKEKHRGNIKTTSIKLSTEEDTSQFSLHFKVLFAMDTMMESIEEKKPKRQSSMDNPETLATVEHKTQNEDKQQTQ
jgi:hypothetical protein